MTQSLNVVPWVTEAALKSRFGLFGAGGGSGGLPGLPVCAPGADANQSESAKAARSSRRLSALVELIAFLLSVHCRRLPVERRDTVSCGLFPAAAPPRARGAVQPLRAGRRLAARAEGVVEVVVRHRATERFTTIRPFIAVLGAFVRRHRANSSELGFGRSSRLRRRAKRRPRSSNDRRQARV